MRRLLNTHSTGNFIQDIIPQLISGKEKLKAVFSTYNSVGHFDTGFVETGNCDLEIFVINGCRENIMEVFANQLIAMSMPENTVAQKMLVETFEYDKRDAENSMTCVRGTALEAFNPDESFLYFTYVGISAINQSIRYAEEIKEKYPNATVIVVACDCDYERKKIAFSEAYDKNKIDYVIFSQICGGEIDMSKIVRGLINEWDKVH